MSEENLKPPPSGLLSRLPISPADMARVQAFMLRELVSRDFQIVVLPDGVGFAFQENVAVQTVGYLTLEAQRDACRGAVLNMAKTLKTFAARLEQAGGGVGS